MRWLLVHHLGQIEKTKLQKRLEHLFFTKIHPSGLESTILELKIQTITDDKILKSSFCRFSGVLNYSKIFISYLKNWVSSNSDIDDGKTRISLDRNWLKSGISTYFWPKTIIKKLIQYLDRHHEDRHAQSERNSKQIVISLLRKIF